MRLVPPHPLTGNFQKDFFLWWFAFNQVRDMPEELIEGRAHIYQNWFWNSLLYKKDALTERDRAVYAHAYNTRDGIRGGNGWYQAYAQDLDDQLTYPDRLTVPSLGIGGLGNGLLVEFMQKQFADPQLQHLPESGHYIAEEAPEQVIGFLADFLQSVRKNKSCLRPFENGRSFSPQNVLDMGAPHAPALVQWHIAQPTLITQICKLEDEVSRAA